MAQPVQLQIGQILAIDRPESGDGVVVEIDPQRADAWNNLGVLLEEAGVTDLNVAIFGNAERTTQYRDLIGRLDAELVTVFRYQAHLRGGDFPVDALRSFECDV